MNISEEGNIDFSIHKVLTEDQLARESNMCLASLGVVFKVTYRMF